MASERRKVAKIYLTSWQQRMLKEFMSKDEIKRFRLRDRPPTLMRLKYGKPECPASYKIPAGGMVPGDYVIYLTDTQMLQVQKELGLKTAVAEINVSRQEIKAGNVRFYA